MHSQSSHAWLANGKLGAAKHVIQIQTSCRRAAATVCTAPLLPSGCQSAFRRWADGSVEAVSHGQHILMATAAVAWCANMVVSKADWWPWPLTLKVMSESRDVAYLCANFGLPRPLCSRLRPDVRDRRQTKASLNAPPIRGGGITIFADYRRRLYSTVAMILQWVCHVWCVYVCGCLRVLPNTRWRAFINANIYQRWGRSKSVLICISRDCTYLLVISDLLRMQICLMCNILTNTIQYHWHWIPNTDIYSNSTVFRLSYSYSL